MGSLAKALLRRKDPSLQHACARVDSVDLAKKRLAAKTRAEMGGGLDASGQACVDGEPAEGTVDAEQGNQSNVPPHLEVLTIASDDEGDGVPTPLAARQLNDSIRIAKQRLRQRASIDVVSGPQIQASRSRASWSSSGTPRHLTEDGTQPEGGTEDDGHRHVHFRSRRRRASDGEILHRRKSGDTSGGPGSGRSSNPLKRFLKRLTANLDSLYLPSAAPATRSKSTTSSVGSPQAATAAPAAAAAASGGGGRVKRSSAPGEFLVPGPFGGRDREASCPASPRLGSASASKEVVGGRSRASMWLARISQGIVGGASSRGAWSSHQTPGSTTPCAGWSPTTAHHAAASAGPAVGHSGICHTKRSSEDFTSIGSVGAGEVVGAGVGTSGRDRTAAPGTPPLMLPGACTPPPLSPLPAASYPGGAKGRQLQQVLQGYQQQQPGTVGQQSSGVSLQEVGREGAGQEDVVERAGRGERQAAAAHATLAAA